MAIMRCPHCEHEVDLGSADPGFYECPHCGGEFEFGNDERPMNKIFRELYAALFFFIVLGVPWLLISSSPGSCSSLSDGYCPGGGP